MGAALRSACQFVGTPTWQLTRLFERRHLIILGIAESTLAARCLGAIVPLSPLGLPKANAGSATIFVNEFHARGFKASAARLEALRDEADACRPRADERSQHQLRPRLRVSVGSNRAGCGRLDTVRQTSSSSKSHRANDFDNSVEKRLTGKYAIEYRLKRSFSIFREKHMKRKISRARAEQRGTTAVSRAQGDHCKLVISRRSRGGVVLTPPNRQRRKLGSCGPLEAGARELATDNGKLLQNQRPS